MPSKNRLVVIVVLSTIFGLFSGVVGSIITRVYILEDAFKVPLFGELNFADQQSGSNIVIHNAKNVVVEQNVKIAEVVKSSKESILWIYERISAEKSDVKKNENFENTFDINKHYRVGNHIAQGFVLTSDGWFVSEFLPKNAPSLTKSVKSTSTNLVIQEILKDYIVLDRNGNQYNISSIIHDDVSGFTYWKINATGLSVKKFGIFNEIESGQISLAINSKGQIWLTSISGIINDEKTVEYSDVFDPQLLLNEKVEEDFYTSFLFDINGNALGLINESGVVRPMSSFTNCINCLLEKSVISRSTLGIYYVDLAKYFYNENDISKKGALITKNQKGVFVEPHSPASTIGFKEGDIIIAVNGKELNRENGLSYLINSYKAGDKINLEYIRAGKSNQVEVVLGGI